MSYCTYWNLREKPFEEVCNSHFFFESDDHREAFDRMQYVVNDRNMNICLLTGEIGSGKTITKNVLRSALSPHHFQVIDFENSHFPFDDILYDIITRIRFRDPEPHMHEHGDTDTVRRGDKYMLIKAFTARLETLVYREKRHLVILFDEAQQMDEHTIEEIKNLTNISSETHNYLTVFFIGQPELRAKISRLKQVDQRIFLRFHLNNLGYNNTLKYIQHRLRVAGSKSEAIFTQDACERIFHITGGIPREINRLCKLALNYGYAHQLPEISGEDIDIVAHDITQQ
jgi:general secretion pathway protein A